MFIGAIVLALLILAFVVTLLLKRQLREKYAAIWLVIGVAVLLIGVLPGVLDWMTRTLGFQVPANLLFTLAIVLLLAVALHLSWEQSRAEEEVRRLAEEAAISTLEVEQLSRRVRSLEARLQSERPVRGEDPHTD